MSQTCWRRGQFPKDTESLSADTAEPGQSPPFSKPQTSINKNRTHCRNKSPEAEMNGS